MDFVKQLLKRVDQLQQRHTSLAFPIAVNKKFGDDEGGNLAALIAYYGFFSLLPLLAVLVTILGYVLDGDPHLRQKILTSTFAQFPIIGDQLRSNVHSVRGSGLTLALGIAGTLYGGLGVANAAQTAFNRVWEVPRAERPGFIPRVTRSLLLLVVVGGGILAATTVNGRATASNGFGVFEIGAILLGIALNVGLFLVAFRLLTVHEVAPRDLVPGAVFAAVTFQILQMVGGLYVSHTLKNASSTYGFFGIVLGLLAWVYLQARVLLLAAEINVVRLRRLYPRALFPPPQTDADRRALEQYAQTEERRKSEDISVTFDRQAGAPDAPAPAGHHDNGVPR
jgi:YihY family inner membrane protein